jgi:hypothetical protein
VIELERESLFLLIGVKLARLSIGSHSSISVVNEVPIRDSEEIAEEIVEGLPEITVLIDGEVVDLVDDEENTFAELISEG